MPLNLQKLQSWSTVETLFEYTDRDTIFYALAVGMGSRPIDPQELRFVYESKLRVLPTMATVMSGGHIPWLFDPETGINLDQMLQGETGLTVYRPLPAQGVVRCRTSIEGITDRGEQKGATLYFRQDLHIAADEGHLASISGCFVMRDGGGGGSFGHAVPAARRLPAHSPDETIDLATLPQSALMYRLTGDRNSLHADPQVARRAGFDRPILHGLCTFGIAGRALLERLCGYQPDRLRRMDVRFSAPLYPGETLRTEIWRADGDTYAFRSTALERGVVVLTNGYAEITDAAASP